MDIRIVGGQKLSGEVIPSGSKNSALAILTASVLIEDPIVLTNIPNLSDVQTIISVLEQLGSKISWNKESRSLHIDNRDLHFHRFTKAEIGDMKGTAMLWGAMLGRFGKSDFEDLPGGCTLGARPIDAHFAAFRDLGVSITESKTGVSLDSTHAKATEIWLTEMSPTATANAVMLAVSLNGTTVIRGAASELSVQDLCLFLKSAGAKIAGVGGNVLVIEGGQRLSKTQHAIFSDHYEIATFLALAACTEGEIAVHQALPTHFKPIVREFAKFNVTVKYEGSTAIVRGGQPVTIGTNPGKTILVRPQPWPALPVDMLPLFIPLALEAPQGTTLFHNWMYESALFWTTELLNFGANVIILDPHRMMTVAGNPLKGATVRAPYIIRATVALIMTALIADGESIIRNADNLERGHDNFVEKLRALGANIEKIG